MHAIYVQAPARAFRAATDRDALGESPWRDIAGYGLLGAARLPTMEDGA